jgi:hypothetical protein
VKTLLLLPFICLTISAFGQRCDSFLVINKDKYTDIEEVSMARPVIITQGENGTLVLQLKPTRNKSIIFEAKITSKSFGCIDEQATLYFVFDNKEKFSLHNQSKINCKGLSVVYLTGGLGNKGLLTLMTKKKLTAIRIASREESFEADLTEVQGIELNKALNCMLKR